MAAYDNKIKNYSAKTTAMAFGNMFPALVIANMVPALSGMVNGIIVGNSFSTEAMAAVSFVAPVSLFIASIAIIFSSGAGIAYGRYLGMGREEDVHRVYTADIMALLIIGALLTVAGELFANPIAYLIGAEGDTLAETVAYLRGIFIGIIPILIIPSMVTFLNLGNEAGYGMLSSLLLAILNLILGLLNVRIFHGGMFGIGLASSIAQYCALLFLFIRFKRRPELGHIISGTGMLSEIGKMIRYGIPAAAIQVGTSIRNMIINTLTLAVGGTVAVAGLGILNSTAEFFFSVDTALVSATATLISISIGEEDRTSLNNLVSYLLKAGAIAFVGVGVIYSLAAPYIAMLFGAKGEGIEIAALCIRLCSTELLTSWFCRVILGTYQSFGRVKLTTVLQVLIACVYGIGVAVFSAKILPVNMRIYGLWGCYGIAQLFGVITIIIIAWVKNRSFSVRIEDLLCIDETFGVEDKDRIAVTVDSMEDVVNVAQTVQSFLKDRNIDEERSFKTALCLEEMAGNIVSHGFTKENHKNNTAIDIYVAVKNDDIKIRIRDNAPQFNPFKKLEQYKKNENDPAKNIGIRMISSIAKEMKYHTTLGMNVLTIEL